MTRLSDLTAFVITTGEEPVDECLERLRGQTCSFRIEEIAGVYPMSAAFQAMPDRCETRYFLQVDADMLLHEDAVDRLYEALRASGPRTYMVSGLLHEDGVGPRGALKCWRRALFRVFRFRDVRTVDRDLYRRAGRVGLRFRQLGEEVGLHRTRHTPFTAYLKAKADVEKWRFLRRPAERYALPLLDEALADAAAERERLLGTLVGALTHGPRLVRSKDIRHERALHHELTAGLGLRASPAALAEEVRELFADAYAADPRRPQPGRAALAEAVVAGFSAGPADGAAERLVALAGR